MNPNESIPPAIVAENLTKVYGSGNTEVVAMRDVSLRVARGEVIALLGPSGAGKSTLIKILGGIHPRGTYDGEVLIDGPHPHWRRVGHGGRSGQGGLA